MTSEQLLLTYAQTGDESLFDELVRRHHAKLVNWLCRYTGKYDLAIEIAQTTWVKVWKYCRSFRGLCKFVTWLTTLARNTAIEQFEHLNRRSRFVELPFQENIPIREPQTGLASQEDSPRPILATALRRLSRDARKVVYLTDLLELNYEQAAKRMGVAVGTIRSRRHRAIAIMRRELAERERLPKEIRRELSR